MPNVPIFAFLRCITRICAECGANGFGWRRMSDGGISRETFGGNGEAFPRAHRTTASMPHGRIDCRYSAGEQRALGTHHDSFIRAEPRRTWPDDIASLYREDGMYDHGRSGLDGEEIAELCPTFPDGKAACLTLGLGCPAQGQAGQLLQAVGILLFCQHL